MPLSGKLTFIIVVSARLTSLHSNMTQRFEEFEMSNAWASSKCYAKAIDRTENPDKKNPLCDLNDMKEDEYCPNPHVLVVARCFTTQTTSNHEETLKGIRALPKYHNLTLSRVLEYSWNNYLVERNQFVKPSSVSGQGTLALDHMAVDSMIRLPLCKSKYVELGKTSWKGTDAKFPFICGDFTGNETESFMDRLHWGKESKDFKLKKPAELFQKTCKQHLFLPYPF